MSDARDEDLGGEDVCYLHLTCEECGAVLEQPRTAHLAWCSAATDGAEVDDAPTERRA